MTFKEFPFLDTGVLGIVFTVVAALGGAWYGTRYNFKLITQHEANKEANAQARKLERAIRITRYIQSRLNNDMDYFSNEQKEIDKRVLGLARDAYRATVYPKINSRMLEMLAEDLPEQAEGNFEILSSVESLYDSLDYYFAYIRNRNSYLESQEDCAYSEIKSLNIMVIDSLKNCQQNASIVLSRISNIRNSELTTERQKPIWLFWKR